MHNGRVPGVEPAIADGFVGGFGVAIVTLEYDVAADHDLANRAAIVRDLFTGLGIHHPELAGGDELDTLPSLDDSPLGPGPPRMCRQASADRDDGRGLRQAVDLG